MINRLASTVLLDFRQQVRYGFVVAAAFSVIVMVGMLSQFDAQGSQLFLPVFILGNLILGTFYFIAGMVLFEKGEGVLQGLVVTPLRVEEYLGSKVLTLTALAIVENLAIATVIFGTGYNVPLLVAATILTAMVYVLLGFVLVSRYGSISEYLMPSAVITIFLTLPLFDYLKVFETPLMYLHPMQAPLVLLKAAVMPVETWQLAYGAGYSLLLVAVMFILARRAFDRYIVNREGGH
ncbi:MAG: ABC-2 family transporter protein [Methanocella sp. PtaU1.Bin125]|nr:MAG: ABC-2 family transporter protein [Methanocella sp. PtaU1.Bin125]